MPPVSNQRQKVNCNMAKENMEETSILPFENLGQLAQFPGRNLPGQITNLAKPEAPQKMKSRPWNDINLIHRKPRGVFSLLRDYHRLKTLEAGDLPVDVEHLRLQKSRAIERDDWPWISRFVQW